MNDLPNTLEDAIEEIVHLRELAGSHDPTGADHMEEMWVHAQRADAAEAMLRSVLEELTFREYGYLMSDISPGKPAPNYELMLRLNLDHLLGLEVTDA